MTIPKNTKRAKQLISEARNIRCYSLSNDFRGEPLSDDPVTWGGPIVNNHYTQLVHISQTEFLMKELNGFRTKLTGDNGHYCIHVHSNLWYDFEVTQ